MSMVHALIYAHNYALFTMLQQISYFKENRFIFHAYYVFLNEVTFSQ
jgi:hypothetical protein